MNFTEWRHSRKTTLDDNEEPCYEYGPGRNIVNILSSGRYGLHWMGYEEESHILLDLEVKLYNFATRDGCL